jgi:hypothetical protein
MVMAQKMPKNSRQWSQAEQGAAIGTIGSEGGLTLVDEEYAGEARTCLERKEGAGAPFAITCGV